MKPWTIGKICIKSLNRTCHITMSLFTHFAFACCTCIPLQLPLVFWRINLAVKHAGGIILLLSRHTAFGFSKPGDYFVVSTGIIDQTLRTTVPLHIDSGCAWQSRALQCPTVNLTCLKIRREHFMILKGCLNNMLIRILSITKLHVWTVSLVLSCV